MTASPSIDAYDAQMLDFSSDPDVPMNITGSAEFFSEALMDQDGHLAASTYSEHPSVEVDMEEYVGDNAEYEMADETAVYQRPRGEELLDIEVYDASHAPSPLIPLRSLQPSVDVSIDSEHQATTSPSYSEHATHVEPEVHHTPPGDPAADFPHVEPSASGESASLEHHPSDVPHESRSLTSESREQLGDLASTEGQLLEAPAPAGTNDEVDPPIAADSEAIQHENLEPPTAEPEPLSEDADAAGTANQDDKVVGQVPTAGQETTDPLYLSNGVYIDSPLAVLLSVASDPEPRFALFNSPDIGDESAEDASGTQKVYSLLLEDRPTLYYEPLSSVFEALRQDEGLLSRIPHSFEGELVLDARELQLAVSEDNVHSREISLHDLNILHDGSDFAGPLRLHLRAVVPRFIIRYYALQEQIQRLRLHVAAGTGEENHEEYRDHYDATGEQPLPQQEEATEPPSLSAAAISEGVEVPLGAGGEEPVKGPASESTEEAPQESCESEDATITQEPTAEYHEVTGEAIHNLEDENDYEGTNVGDEDESAKSVILDADQAHDVAAEDTDAPATVIGQESEFGSEHLDYVHAEYDERYGEELPERAEGASSVQYDEHPHYDEEGEQDASTVVDETQAPLPNSDENEEYQSDATPTPGRAILEPKTSEHIAVNTNESVSRKQDIPASSNEEPVASESKNEVDYVQPLGSEEQESSTVTRVFSEVEESDSNFVKMLERDADAEFDRTFNAEQSGQEGSVEATLQRDESWDDWDDEDAEGDDEEDWIDPDADSNESSVTLSSKASSKRNYNEVDPGELLTVQNSQNSPGSKRPRVE